MAEEKIKLGGKLKSYRASKKMTLEQLSKLAGVSKAMLSQIEKNKVNPTVAIMLKITDVLGVEIGDILDQPSKNSILKVIPHTDKHYTFSKDKYCTIRTLTPLSQEKSIEFYKVTIEAGGKLRSEPHFAGTEEFVHVAKGKISLISGNNSRKLAKGDSIHYRADLIHTMENLRKSQAEIYLVVRYKNA